MARYHRRMAGLMRKRKAHCDACGEVITDRPAGHGTIVALRNDDVVHEDKPLCERCAHAIGMAAMFRFAEEEEEG